MRKFLPVVCVLWSIGAGVATRHACANGFVDPLDEAAAPDTLAQREILVSVTRAGDRLVAVGPRGLAIYSDDHGGSWKQAAVPVQADLTSASFLNEKEGWISGHSGVILHTLDGGTSWTKQFDGKGDVAFVETYQKRVDQGDAAAKSYLDTMKLNTKNGPDLPYLGVMFENEHDGWAVGPYGMLIASHDGGASWEPWLDHIDNPQFLNLNAVASIDGEVYIAGEQGKVYRLDRAAGRFVTTDTGYAGSLFGIAGTAKGMVAYGLLGHAFRSVDKGAHWTALDTGLPISIGGATVLPGDRIVLATQAGVLLTGALDGGTLKPVQIKGSFPFAGVAPNGGDRLALVGLGGVAIAQLP